MNIPQQVKRAAYFARHKESDIKTESISRIDTGYDTKHKLNLSQARPNIEPGAIERDGKQGRIKTMSMKLDEVRAEFARRKVQFHGNEKAEDVTLWGLFLWGAVSKYIKSGQVIADDGYEKKHKTIWCRPSPEEWKNHIEPLTKTKTLDELSRMAGWSI